MIQAGMIDGHVWRDWSGSVKLSGLLHIECSVAHLGLAWITIQGYTSEAGTRPVVPSSRVNCTSGGKSFGAMLLPLLPVHLSLTFHQIATLIMYQSSRLWTRMMGIAVKGYNLIISKFVVPHFRAVYTRRTPHQGSNLRCKCSWNCRESAAHWPDAHLMNDL